MLRRSLLHLLHSLAPSTRQGDFLAHGGRHTSRPIHGQASTESGRAPFRSRVKVRSTGRTPFATMRHRTKRANGCLTFKTTELIFFKMIREAENIDLNYAVKINFQSSLLVSDLVTVLKAISSINKTPPDAEALTFTYSSGGLNDVLYRIMDLKMNRVDE